MKGPRAGTACVAAGALAPLTEVGDAPQMAAEVKLRELTVHEPVDIGFGFTGLSEKHAVAIVRDILRDGWPTQVRPKQSVYSIRLVGEVAVAYPLGFSPVAYIGEGNAFTRLYDHTNWLVPLLISVPQLRVQIRILEVARKNNTTLYSHIEADLLRWFSESYGALPWFNRQWEGSKEGVYSYEAEAWKELKKMVGIGSGTKYQWAIQPTPNNIQHEPYAKGIVR